MWVTHDVSIRLQNYKILLRIRGPEVNIDNILLLICKGGRSKIFNILGTNQCTAKEPSIVP